MGVELSADGTYRSLSNGWPIFRIDPVLNYDHRAFWEAEQRRMEQDGRIRDQRKPNADKPMQLKLL